MGYRKREWQPMDYIRAQDLNDMSNATDQIINDALQNYNCINYSSMFGTFTDRTSNPSLTWNAEKTRCTVSGTTGATAASNYIINMEDDIRPFVSGKTYRFYINSSSTALYMRIAIKVSGEWQASEIMRTSRDYTMPDGMEGIRIYVYMAANSTFANASIEFSITNTKSNIELTRDIETMNTLCPDSFAGGDTNRVQQCVNALSGKGGIIIINRKYTINDVVTCTHRTDSSDEPYNDKTYIMFVGIGQDAGFEFGSASACFSGNTNGSPYGGFRFERINFTRPESGLGLGSAFTNVSGLIRTVFHNCRFNGFAKVFDCSDNGVERTKLAQNIVCDKCYFGNIADYVFDVYTVGESRRAAYIYAVTIRDCIVEKCKGLIKGSGTSGYSVWTSLLIEGCTIENNHGIPIVFGVGARSVSIEHCYFEKNDYNDSHICIDMNNLYGSSGNANVFGVSIKENAFIRGVDSATYTARCTGIRLPAREPISDYDAPERTHGMISGNRMEDIAITYNQEIPFTNRRRWKFEDNEVVTPINRGIFYSERIIGDAGEKKSAEGAGTVDIADGAIWRELDGLTITLPYKAGGYTGFTVTLKNSTEDGDSDPLPIPESANTQTINVPLTGLAYTIYGGTMNVVTGVLQSEYNSSGTPVRPREYLIEPNSVRLFSGTTRISVDADGATIKADYRAKA